MDEPRIIEDIAALAARIDRLGAGLVAFDGVNGAGKTGTMRRVAERLGCPAIDVDAFVNRDQKQYVEAVRYDDLRAAIKDAERTSALVLVAGVCIRNVLARLGRSARLSVYVQAMTKYGPLREDMLDAEDGKINGTYAASRDNNWLKPLDVELWNYHFRARPSHWADIIFQRHPANEAS